MRVLVVGNGGREDALCKKLQESPLCEKRRKNPCVNDLWMNWKVQE